MIPIPAAAGGARPGRGPLSEVISAAGLEPVDYPSIEISQLAKDKPFIFKLTVEVYPEVKLANIRG